MPRGIIVRTFLSLVALVFLAGSATAGWTAGRSASPGTERRTLAAIEEQSAARVDELARRISAMPDGAARQELEHRALQIKRDTQLEMLRLQASYAGARGDRAAVRRIEDSIEQLLRPRVRTPLVSRAPKKGDR
jgi:hypothetical protein